MEGNLIFITTLMATKTLTKKLEDAGKYSVFSTAIAAMIVVFLNRAAAFTVEEAATVVGGLTVLLNLTFVVLNDKFDVI